MRIGLTQSCTDRANHDSADDISTQFDINLPAGLATAENDRNLMTVDAIEIRAVSHACRKDLSTAVPLK